MLHPYAPISSSEVVSLIWDDMLEKAILLNESTGEYWAVTGITYRVVRLIYSRPQTSISHLIVNISETDASTIEGIIEQLANSGLLSLRLNQTAHPCWRDIVEYSLYYIFFSIVLRIQGWKPVFMIRRHQNQLNVPLSSAVRPAIVDEMVAISRWACLLPGIRRNCVPSSLAIFRMLTKRGYTPQLCVGGEVTPFEPHMWCEVHGHRIDIGVAEQAVKHFRSTILHSDPLE